MITPIGRFAPSPSGRMHLGNLFSALLAWLSATSRGGDMVLRLEDLDTQRCTQPYCTQVAEDLSWLGLTWTKGGDASHHQSNRTQFYQQALETLQNQGLVYPCFCTRGELHAANAPHRSDGTLLYSGACRGLSCEAVARRSAMRPGAQRLQVNQEVISFEDGHLGAYSQSLSDECGDFLLQRSDGLFAYQLAVVVDDGAMGITEVVRGADLLDSTPRQLYLYRLLGLTPPTFYHLPLLLSQDGRRLSKRDGDLGLDVLSQRFTAPELVGKLAYLAGLNPEGTPKTPQALCDTFSWDLVPKEDIFVPQDLF